MQFQTSKGSGQGVPLPQLLTLPTIQLGHPSTEPFMVKGSYMVHASVWSTGEAKARLTTVTNIPDQVVYRMDQFILLARSLNQEPASQTGPLTGMVTQTEELLPGTAASYHLVSR